MACRKACRSIRGPEEGMSPAGKTEKAEAVTLRFGVDTAGKADEVLQNNLTEFEWVARNKLYPDFWGRNLVGENCLTEEEIRFLHRQGCKIAAIYPASAPKETEKQGVQTAKEAGAAALALGIPAGTAIFFEIEEGEKVTSDFMKGFAKTLLSAKWTPGFKVSTDAKFMFDREYSRGMQAERELFAKCLIWAVAPSLPEFERTTTTHLIYPDAWLPYAPSGITRREIAIWQYGKNCHPIESDVGKEMTFNVDLVRDERVILEKMF